MIKKQKVKKQTVSEACKIDSKNASKKGSVAMVKSPQFNLKQLGNYREFIRYLLSDDIDCESID